ncbi:hypothetical protein ACFL12_06615, partial [Pseudomonadota bacterium]
KGKGGRALMLPSGEGAGGAVYVIGGDDGLGGPWGWSGLHATLPKGSYVLQGELDDSANDAALGFALAAYAFDRYKKQNEENQSDTRLRGPR